MFMQSTIYQNFWPLCDTAPKMEKANSAKEAMVVEPKQLSGVGFEAREVAARIYSSLVRSGMAAGDARVHVQAGVPGVSDRTLRRWAAQIESKRPLFVGEKESGRPKSVNDDQIRVLVGWILTTTDSGTLVKVKDALTFLQDRIGIVLSECTLRRYLSTMGVSIRAAIVGRNTEVSFDEKLDVYIDWIKQLRSSGSTSKLMCSLDFTYTSHRSSRPTSLAGRGRKSSAYSSKTRFTNCIITGVLSDGRQLESILYTFNSQFRTDRTTTKRRKLMEDELKKAQKKYRVKDKRIVYDGKLEKETRTFVREYDDMVRDFLEFHKDTLKAQEVVYLSDNGSAFLDGDESIIEQLGYGKHIFYPPCVHQFMSPNDNKLHGAAKAKWRSMFNDFDNDVECSIALMSCLDSIPKDDIRTWWVENLFLTPGIVREEKVKKAILGEGSKWSRLHDACIDEYHDWAAIENAEAEGEGTATVTTDGGLDGPYWAK